MASRAYKAAFAAAFGVALLVQTAFAQVSPPSWWNVNDGMTSSFGYTFDTDAFPPVAGVDLAPYGEPDWMKDGRTAWYESYNGHSGVWGVPTGGEGSMGITLHNMPVSTNTKHMWVQLDYFAESGYDIGFDISPDSGIDLQNLVQHYDYLGEGWTRLTLTYDLVPQPRSESLKVMFHSQTEQSGAYLDNFYVGTHCQPSVPSPAALLPFGLGALVAFRRRRK